MDSAPDWKAVYELIRLAMPRVAALMAERRREVGAAHVAECQRRGMAGEPGWFFAREGALAVGTPWSESRQAESVFDELGTYAGKTLVCLRPAEDA